jgi:hypothetical protein
MRTVVAVTRFGQAALETVFLSTHMAAHQHETLEIFYICGPCCADTCEHSGVYYGATFWLHISQGLDA